MAEPDRRYSGVSIALHWITALAVVGQIVLITIADEVSGSERGYWFGLHKSLGLTILVLTLARLAWRFGHRWIALPDDTPGWQALLARATHILFYVVLLAMPLLGWIASSAANRPIEWFGLFLWPELPAPDSRGAAKAAMQWHESLAKVLYVLVGLHVAGALKHHFVDRDGVLTRMLPFLKPLRR